MLERDNNRYLIRRCKEQGMMVEKFTSPSGSAKPDWIISYQKRVIFLEMKATGKEPTAAQKRDHQRRLDHGIEVVWTDSFEGIEVILQYLMANIPLRSYKY